MNTIVSKASKYIEATGKCYSVHKTPDVIIKSDARNKAFSKEYERFKHNQHHFTNLMVTPDAFPLMCELFDAIKKHLGTMQEPQLWAKDYGEPVVNFPYLGRTWTIKLLFTGMNRKNELYISINYPEPIRSPMAILAFDMPEHWEF